MKYFRFAARPGASLLLLVLAGVAALFPASAADDADLCAHSLATPELGIPACTRLIERGSDSAEVPNHYNNRGVAKVALGNFLDAVADFTSALDRDPSFVDAYRNRGLAWQRASEHDKAIADFTRALKLKPNDESLYNARGSALFSKDEFGGAIEDFNRATKINAKYAPSYLNRGLALHAQRKFDKANEDFTAYIKLAPGDVRGFTNRAALRMDRADFAGAVADYSEAIKRNPKSAIAFSGRGEAYRLMGSLDRSRADHDQAVALAPGPDVYVNRSLLHQSRGDFDAALSDCNEAILLDPRHLLAYVNRGAIRTSQRDLKGALADLDKAAMLNDKSPLPFVFRGNALREAGRNDEAIADFDKALRILPDFVAALTGRGLAYERANDLSKARADYEKAVSLPSSVDYALTKPAQELARKRIAALIEAHASEEARLARAAAEAEARKRAEAQQAAKDASAARMKSDVEARARAEAERVARLNFEAKVRAEAGAEVAERTRAMQERIEAEQRMRAASEARDRADYEARVRAEAEQRAKAEFDARLRAELETRARALAEEKAKAMAEAALKSQAKLVVRPPEKRIALVIGNSAYKNVPALANSKSDAVAVAEALRSVGFQSVTTAFDLGRDQFVATIRRFEDEAATVDWALIYYAGHGMEANGRNFIIPTDANLKSDRDLADEAIALDRILTATERAKKLRIIVLDACRDNPFANSMRRAGARVSSGLARIEPEGGTLVAYAARDGHVALDGRDGNSPFSAAFVRTVKRPGLEVSMMFRSIRDQVMAETRKQQEPITFGSLSGESFYFVEN